MLLPEKKSELSQGSQQPLSEITTSKKTQPEASTLLLFSLHQSSEASTLFKLLLYQSSEASTLLILSLYQSSKVSTLLLFSLFKAGGFYRKMSSQATSR